MNQWLDIFYNGAIFFKDTIATWFFVTIFIAFLVFIIRMNRANGEYQKFRLAHLFMRGDGTLDRKGLRDTLLFLASLYGFFHVLHHYHDLIVSYLWALMTIWGIYHVADNKIPSFGVPTVPGLHSAPSGAPRPGASVAQPE